MNLEAEDAEADDPMLEDPEAVGLVVDLAEQDHPGHPGMK